MGFLLWENFYVTLLDPEASRVYAVFHIFHFEIHQNLMQRRQLL